MTSYTHGHAESVLKSHRWRTAENSVAYVLPHLVPGQSLLDVGSGPGTITLDLAERVAPGRVTALEHNDAALDLTRAEAARRGRTDMDFVVGDVHDLPFPDDSFDVVHAHQVLHHVADPVAALREMRRVAKPGGLVAVRETDYRGKVWYPTLPGLDLWMEVFQKCARANGGEPDAGRRLLSWTLAAGFADVVPSASLWCFATPEDRAYWGGMWAERILTSAIAGQALEQGYTRADLQEISDAWRTWTDSPDGWVTLLHGEILARA
ncbi:MAG: class I SAM-dependent methyltransferase [Sporichthyaceae bacterium]